MKFNPFKSIYSGLIVLSFAIPFLVSPVVADTVYNADEIAKNIRVIESKYDPAKDRTTITMNPIFFQVSDYRENKGVHRADTLMFWLKYQFTGQEPKRPEKIRVIVYELGSGASEFSELLLRNGEAMKRVEMESGYVTNASNFAIGALTVEDLFQLCEGNELFFKFDNQNRVFRINNHALRRLRAIRDTIPK